MKPLMARVGLLFGIIFVLSRFVTTPVFAQTVTPTPPTDQSTGVIQDVTTGSNQNTTIILTPDQQSLTSLPNPGLLPDSPLYFFKRWGENIQTFFTIDDYQRAQLQLHFAQVRLSEAQAELQKNNTNLSDQMLSDYNKDIQSVSASTQKLAEEGKEVTSLVDKIKDREQTRLALLQDELKDTTDPVRKQQLQNAINFTTRQSQTNVNRLVHAITHTPNYQPSAYQSVSGQVTSLNAPDLLSRRLAGNPLPSQRTRPPYLSSTGRVDRHRLSILPMDSMYG